MRGQIGGLIRARISAIFEAIAVYVLAQKRIL
jgi:hypothetical protein